MAAERPAIRNSADASLLMLSEPIAQGGGYLCGIAYFDVTQYVGWNEVPTFGLVMHVRMKYHDTKLFVYI